MPAAYPELSQPVYPETQIVHVIHVLFPCVELSPLNDRFQLIEGTRNSKYTPCKYTLSKILNILKVKYTL